MDSYTPLPPEPATTPAVARRRPFKVSATVIVSTIFLVLLIGLIINQSTESIHPPRQPQPVSPARKSFLPPSRGVPEGVSEKSFRGFSDVGIGFSWTNAMFAWQRTGYHFQPQKNWMNDPDGPLFHKGWYHLFYQYNPDSAIWGNITWGHAVSKDLINWYDLPFAMIPDEWFDINGVWTGSATLLPDGNIVILYTGDTNDSVQVQNLAYPANVSDPLLLEWVKYPDNPVIVPPLGIGSSDFRDPTTMWVGSDGDWRVTIGTKVNTTGMALVYTTRNFTTYEAVDGILHAVEGTGMWECVDFYPVSTDSGNGLDTSDIGPGIKHVLKTSLDDDKHDYYAIGVYEPENETWTPDNPEEDVGIGLRVDYGRFYASKTFYDQNKARRILWGWAGETDSEDDDLAKGWASLQTVPRVVVFDNKTGTNLLQWPVEEVESLRSNFTEFTDVEVRPGSVVPINISSASQLDIIAEFEIDGEAVNASTEADVGYNCSSGAIARGALGPFGLLVITTETLSELTPIYFYVAKGIDGDLKTFFCSDNSRSTLASDVDNRVYGGKVPVLDGETLSMRLLVDHSIVESFAQGGRTCITTRVYPTEAIYEGAHLFFFNNATGVNVTASIKIWQMDNAYIGPFPFDQI